MFYNFWEYSLQREVNTEDERLLFSSRLVLSLNNNANVATSRRFDERTKRSDLLEMHSAPMELAFGGITSDER